MKTLLMVLMFAGMLSTVGVYAAGFSSTPSTKALAGSGDESVSAPNTGTVTLGYSTTSDAVTGIIVTWTPSASATYDLTVVAGGTTGSLKVTNSGISERTDTVPIASTEASSISSAKVVISEQ
ncbi:MAG: hypothetical protein BZY75_00720 [SAR202 cluster bacterium Io17-Chloro-G7]|nr:MAG: hypothetical protein BZY75_00720 [SAR202 cluster bacterium Io17-Chloro-G7]